MMSPRAMCFPAAILVLSGCTPGPTTRQTASPPVPFQSAEWRMIDSVLHAAYPADGPGATAIVVRNGKVIYHGAAGMASLELGVPMRPEMVFPLYSITKQFTGAAILLLADEGKLSLDDPLTRFFPDYPTRGRTVTVAHLLAHTSGIANYTDNPAWHAMVRNHVSRNDLIALFRNEDFRFRPGERWEYSNSGYVMLGAIIEQVSGMSYGDFLRNRIFKPLGMSSTFVYDTPDPVIPLRVPGYTRGPAGWRSAEYYSLTHGDAAGNLLSSVDDLARWNGAIERGELLSRRSWNRAFTAFTHGDWRAPRYSAGWFLNRIDTLATAEHAGDFIGGITSVVRVPSENLFVAVLANADPAPSNPERLSLELAAHVLGVSPDPVEIRLSPATLDEYVGVYRAEGAVVRTITREGESLYSQRPGGQKLRIYPIGNDLFYFPGNGISVLFEREDGRVTKASLVERQAAPGTPALRVE